jgi:hypothetical protein
VTDDVASHSPSTDMIAAFFALGDLVLHPLVAALQSTLRVRGKLGEFYRSGNVHIWARFEALLKGVRQAERNDAKRLAERLDPAQQIAV